MGKLKPYFVVFAAATFFLFEFINLNSFDPLNDILRGYYQVSALQISNVSAMYFYANILLLIPAGLLLDRMSIRKMLIGVFAMCIVATVIFAWCRSIHIAMVMRFLIGAGSTLCLLSTAKLTCRWFPPHKTALIMGSVVTIAMLGGVIAQQIPYLVDWTGSWQWAMTAVALLGVVFWLSIIIFVRDNPPGRTAEHEQEQSALKEQGFWSCFFQAMRNTQTWIAGLYTNLLTIPAVVMGALWAKSYIHVVHHQSIVKADLIASMVFFGILVGSPFFGWLSDRWQRRRRPMVWGAILTLVVSLIIVENHSLGFEALMALFFLLGLFSGSQIITYALVMQINPKHLTASSQALSATIIMAAGAIFQPLFGYMLQWHNSSTVYTAVDYERAMWILPISFAVSIVLALMIKEPK